MGDGGLGWGMGPRPLLLTVFFSQVGRGYTVWQIVAGQYLGVNRGRTIHPLYPTFPRRWPVKGNKSHQKVVTFFE